MNRTHGMSMSVLLCFALASCNGSSDDSSKYVGSVDSGKPEEINSSITARPTVTESCHSDDPDLLCLGTKFVSYQNPQGGQVVASEKLAIDDIKSVNETWSQCGIAFQIEKYQALDPENYALSYASGAADELEEIRRTFSEDSTLLIVVTGPWNKAKNAWTEMPGEGPYYGAVLDASVADYPLIMAHEMGHYLNLDHPTDGPSEAPTQMMNWKIYPESRQITDIECKSARAAAKSFWAKMLR